MEEKKSRIYNGIMLVILTAIITFMITAFGLYSYFTNNSSKSFLVSNLFGKTLNGKVDVDSYLTSIKNVIDKYYLWKDDIDEEALKEGAIKGYVSALDDKYAEYIPKSEMKKYTEDIVGNFVGIGVYMTKDEKSNKIVVYYPIPESPAEKAGLKSGDIILKINGTEYSGDDFDDISSYIKGEEGTTVNIVVQRGEEELSFDIKREKITVNPIEEKILENDIGYMQIPSFDENTADDFKSKVETLQKQGMKKLIIDLRNNGGGIVDEAIEIADYLLDKGKVIISTKDNTGNTEQTISENDPIFTMPVVVLINKVSASSSEILASSLKENKRATLVGTTTFGKGIIQTLFSLTDGSGLKMTTAEYFTPNGNNIDKVGIKPDEEIELPEGVNMYQVEEKNDTQLNKALEILK